MVGEDVDDHLEQLPLPNTCRPSVAKPVWNIASHEYWPIERRTVPTSAPASLNADQAWSPDGSFVVGDNCAASQRSIPSFARLSTSDGRGPKVTRLSDAAGPGLR